ncbi:hypothetical protein HJA60_004246 [Vibrio vulnificus]|nr:hypothetical protein [Vibrio vulnificus]MCU8569871.1 hypothetical protein [Vibrio vulnificus]HDM8135355.1 hypothetical protein [Vibrio harveyi]
MDSIEYVRALIPLGLLVAFEVTKRHKERASHEYIGMKSVQLSILGVFISWFSIFIALLLFTQLIIDPPSSLYMTCFMFTIIILVTMISLQHLSLKVFFNDDGFTIRSLFGKAKYCDFAKVMEVKEKRYAGEGNSRVIILILSTGKVKLPISMLGGLHQDELDSLLKNVMDNCAEKYS